MNYGKNILKMHNHDNIIEKLINLTERVNTSDFYEIYTDGKRARDHDKDLIWCKRLLDDVKNSGLVPDKQEFIMANLMWKKYSGSKNVEPTNENMWELIDGMLTQENPTKIGAIKMYRRFIDCTLKEAKEMVDAREIKIKKGW